MKFLQWIIFCTIILFMSPLYPYAEGNDEYIACRKIENLAKEIIQQRRNGVSKKTMLERVPKCNSYGAKYLAERMIYDVFAIPEEVLSSNDETFDVHFYSIYYKRCVKMVERQ